MGRDRTLARGARIFGSLLLSALALVSLGWIIRDFTKAYDVVDVWWNWAGLPARAEDGVWVTSFLEPTLLLTYAVAASAAYRSSSSAAILTCTGVLTIVLRAPGLWNLNADWMQGVPDDLLSSVLFSTIGTVVAGAVLVVTACVGRRPASAAQDTDGHGEGARQHATAQPPPARPTRGGAVAAFVALGAVASVLVAWEIRTMQQFGWDRYERTLTGERSILRLLDSPSGWVVWAVVLLSLVAGVTALADAPFARPLGLIVAAPLLAIGAFALAFDIKSEVLERFGDLGIEYQLHVLTDIFETVAGAAVLLALAYGRRHTPQPGPCPAADPVPYGLPPQAG